MPYLQTQIPNASLTIIAYPGYRFRAGGLQLSPAPPPNLKTSMQQSTVFAHKIPPIMACSY